MLGEQKFFGQDWWNSGKIPSQQGRGVGGKISDSDSKSDLSKISDSAFPKFPTPDSGLSKISDYRSDCLT